MNHLYISNNLWVRGRAVYQDCSKYFVNLHKWQQAKANTHTHTHKKKEKKEDESFYDYNLTNSTNSPNQEQIMKTPSTSILT